MLSMGIGNFQFDIVCVCVIIRLPSEIPRHTMSIQNASIA